MRTRELQKRLTFAATTRDAHRARSRTPRRPQGLVSGCREQRRAPRRPRRSPCPLVLGNPGPRVDRRVSRRKPRAVSHAASCPTTVPSRASLRSTRHRHRHRRRQLGRRRNTQPRGCHPRNPRTSSFRASTRPVEWRGVRCCIELNHRCPHGPRLKRSEIEDRSKLCHSRSIDPYVAVSDRTCRSKTFLSNVRVSCRSRMVAKSRATNLLRVASQHISWHTSRRPPSDAPSSAPLTLPFSTWSRFTSRTAEAEVRPAPASPRCHKKRSPSVVSTTFFRHLADPRSFCRSRAACQSF